MKPKQITSLADLTPDSRNARRHTPRNVGMIETALHEVGAARSIVIDEAGVVLAGNATVDAAAQAGIERVRVVEADGNELIAVQRRGLTKAQKAKLALYDNRATDLSIWDASVLAGLAEEYDLSGLFAGKELEQILASLPLALDVDGNKDGDSEPEIVVPEALPPSYVRMVQLFFTGETQPEFLQMVRVLMSHFEKENLTDTVFEAVCYAYRQFDNPAP